MTKAERTETPALAAREVAGQQPGLPEQSSLARLQGTLGNRALRRWIADRDRAPSAGASPLLQRACACKGAGGGCADCKEKELQRRASGPAPAVAPPVVHEVLRSPGMPLPGDVRGEMEGALGRDLSAVRVHTDERAAGSVRAVGALAYTVGQHVAFERGRFAPHTPAGRVLLAHELAHTVQQGSAAAAGRERPIRIGPAHDAHEQAADRVAESAVASPPGRRARAPLARSAPAVQRAGFLESVARFFGGGTFGDKELLDYLDSIRKSRKIEDANDSDNKARAVVDRWKAGAAAFTILDVPTRILLIKEMMSGYLSGADENRILALLTEAPPLERTHILEALDTAEMRRRFSGDQLKALRKLLDETELDTASALLGPWTAEEVAKIVARHGDEGVIRTIINRPVKITRFDTAFDTWRYPGAGNVEEEVTGLRGNTCRKGPGCPAQDVVRINAKMTVEDAAATLTHEIEHVLQAPETTNDEYLENEVQARVTAEKFRMRHGMPEGGTGYRKPDNTVDVDKIRDEIGGSDHYNPTGREYVRRRYVGETVVTGWALP